MLIDRYNRKVDYLRISATDRCNLRCIYCMPQGGIVQKAPSEILSFEEIIRITKLCTSIGIDKIKISGGEPLVRKDCFELLKSLINLPNIKDVSLTTNGMLVKKYIKGLKNSGLKKMNISMDTLDAQKFRRITKTGKLIDVLNGIDAAIEEGFFVKLNVVMMKGINDDEILKFAKFAQEKQIIVRFIELMPMTDNRLLNRIFYMSCEEIKNKLKILGSLRPIDTEVFGNGPARYYKIEEVSAIVGFISPLSCKFCLHCNRLRLTSGGILMPCLVSQEGVDLKDPLRKNQPEEEILSLIKKAILFKPPEHNFTSSFPRRHLMSQIRG